MTISKYINTGPITLNTARIESVGVFGPESCEPTSHKVVFTMIGGNTNVYHFSTVEIRDTFMKSVNKALGEIPASKPHTDATDTGEKCWLLTLRQGINGEYRHFNKVTKRHPQEEFLASLLKAYLDSVHQKKSAEDIVLLSAMEINEEYYKELSSFLDNDDTKQ